MFYVIFTNQHNYTLFNRNLWPKLFYYCDSKCCGCCRHSVFISRVTVCIHVTRVPVTTHQADVVDVSRISSHNIYCCTPYVINILLMISSLFHLYFHAPKYWINKYLDRTFSRFIAAIYIYPYYIEVIIGETHEP